MNPSTNCPHCGADFKRETILGACNLYACGTTARPPFSVTRTELCREREARQKAEAELAEVRATLLHTREWWATRAQTMSDWVRKNKKEIGEEFVTQYFSIIANGSATHSEPETYATLLNIKEHKINALSAENQKLRELLEKVLWELEKSPFNTPKLTAFTAHRLADRYREQFNQLTK